MESEHPYRQNSYVEPKKPKIPLSLYVWHEGVFAASLMLLAVPFGMLTLFGFIDFLIDGIAAYRDIAKVVVHGFYPVCRYVLVASIVNFRIGRIDWDEDTGKKLPILGGRTKDQ